MINTRQRFFRKSLAQILALLIVPMVIFSAAIMQVAVSYAFRESDRNSVMMLEQAREKLEMSLNVLDGIVTSFDTESEISTQLRLIVRNEQLTLNRFVALRMIRNHISSSVHTRTYIDSVYIYLDNVNDWVLLSDSGLEHIRFMEDQDWLSSFQTHRGTDTMWTEYRPLVKYAFQREDPPYTASIYRIVRNGQGVIVMNLSLAYLSRQMQEMCSYDGQTLILVNEKKELIAESSPLGDEEISTVLTAVGQDDSRMSSTRTDRITAVSLKSLGWRFISVIPQKSLYGLVPRMLLITGILLSVEIITGCILAIIYSQTKHRKLLKIYETFDAATSGMPLPPLPERIGDEYSYIVQNLLISYINQNNLTIQLEQKRLKLQQMELLALQSQINPHFLVNTLRTIFWRSIALTNGKMNDVANMIENLTSLLDFSLSNPQETVTLTQEIDATKSYVKIQQIRRPDHFEVMFDIDPGVADALLPRLIVQPLVENCISHGFTSKKRGLIQVKAARKDNNMLCISIVDNGIGMDKEQQAELNEHLKDEGIVNGHIGLYNTKKRIELYFNQAACLTVESQSGSGTRVELKIPLKLQEETNMLNRGKKDAI